MYFVIHNSGGDTSVKMLTKEQLLEEIQDEDYRPEFLTEADLKKERDPNCWGDAHLVIKGELVVPHPKEKVVQYDVE